MVINHWVIVLGIWHRRGTKSFVSCGFLAHTAFKCTSNSSTWTRPQSSGKCTYYQAVVIDELARACFLELMAKCWKSNLCFKIFTRIDLMTWEQAWPWRACLFISVDFSLSTKSQTLISSACWLCIFPRIKWRRTHFQVTMLLAFSSTQPWECSLRKPHFGADSSFFNTEYAFYLFWLPLLQKILPARVNSIFRLVKVPYLRSTWITNECKRHL